MTLFCPYDYIKVITYKAWLIKSNEKNEDNSSK